MPFLLVTPATQKQQNPSPEELIEIIADCSTPLVIGMTATVDDILDWSIWRRNTNYRAADYSIVAGQRPSNSIFGYSTTL